MRSEKVMNIDNSFKKLDSEIQKIKGKKMNHRPIWLAVAYSGNLICLN